MKRILLALVMICSCMGMYAQSQGEVEMTLSRKDPGIVSGHHKSETQIPSVSYDDSHVYVVAPFMIENATIIIYNEEDEIIYSTVTPLGTTPVTLNLSQYVSDERYSLELIYDDIALIGYF